MTASAIRLSRPSRKKRLISLTPLIDVVFILLVFFMLASSFMEWRAVDILLPTQSNDTASQAEKAPTFITLTRLGDLTIKGESITTASLESTLSQHPEWDPSDPMILVVEPGVSVQAALDIFERLGKAGYTNLSLSQFTESQGE